MFRLVYDGIISSNPLMIFKNHYDTKIVTNADGYINLCFEPFICHSIFIHFRDE